jgi:hypothetical protein
MGPCDSENRSRLRNKVEVKVVKPLFRHAGLDPASSPTFGGIERTGFRLEFIPMKIGAGMTILIEAEVYKRTFTNTQVDQNGGCRSF